MNNIGTIVIVIFIVLTIVVVTFAFKTMNRCMGPDDEIQTIIKGVTSNKRNSRRNKSISLIIEEGLNE